MTRNEEYLNTIITALGGDPTKIPPYTFESEDNLAYLAKAFEGVTPGGGGGVLVVNVTWDGDKGTLDKTWQQINDAAFAVMNVSKSQGNKGRAQVTSTDEPEHVVSVYNAQNGDYYEFRADSATGYPTGGIV